MPAGRHRPLRCGMCWASAARRAREGSDALAWLQQLGGRLHRVQRGTLFDAAGWERSLPQQTLQQQHSKNAIPAAVLMGLCGACKCLPQGA